MSRRGFQRLVKEHDIPSGKIPSGKIMFRRIDLKRLIEAYMNALIIKSANLIKEL